MTTQYIDPQIIFASDAPTQDKPPAFNNYTKGMDETRSNDGRPTIKQFNFIQQQNDFKFLYIHERGACLPFVEGFPYENNAIVFKDGFIQQKNGSSWVIPFMRGSQNLAELTDVYQARTKLDVYSKSEALGKENNLLDVSDKGVARSNLGVYSKAETDAIAGTPNATETTAGKAKIATTATAQAGVNDTDFLTPKKLRDSFNVTGDAPIFPCRAWLTVNTRNGTVYGSGNVSSVTLSQSGIIEIEFTKEMPNVDYAVLFGCAQGSAGTIRPDVHSNTSEGTPSLKTTKLLKIMTSGTTIVAMDNVYIGVFC